MTRIRWKVMAKHCKPNVVLLPIRLTQDDTQQDKVLAYANLYVSLRSTCLYLEDISRTYLA